jgi:DNA replication protein DnaC
MDVKIYNEILKDYENTRNKNKQNLKNIRDEILIKIPKIADIENEIIQLSIDNMKKVINQSEIERDISKQNIEQKLKYLNNKIEELLVKNGYLKDELKLKFDCQMCKDTGYCNGKFCKCFKQKNINMTYKQANILKLKDENFETFDIAYFSNNIEKGESKSPLQNIIQIKDIALEFCENIDVPSQKNLLFIGNTGLGKTFLTNCIADKIIKKGYTAIYQTAPMLMDILIEHKFSYGSNSSKQEYEKIFNSDLLIIDDLGTETMNNIKFTELFNIINTRLLNDKKIVISTNLTLNELYKAYDERVISRLIGNFKICKFIGEDIRLKKKKMG